MNKRQQLLHIEVQDLLTIQLLGPQPPERITQFALTSARLSVTTPLKKEILVTRGQQTFPANSSSTCEPFLFEETTYECVVEILDKSAQQKHFSIVSRGRQLSDTPGRLGRSNIYTCQMNFGSQIGYLDLDFCFDNVSVLKLGLEVFPSKLDYRQDLWQIRADLEHEVRDLAFAIGRLTYHRAKKRREIKAGQVEWLENLRQLFSQLEKAFNRIKIAPRYTIYTDEEIQKANRPTRTGASVRRFIKAHAAECVPAKNGHFRAYGKEWQIRVLPGERKRLTYDIVENRYMKWALLTLLKQVRKNTRMFHSQRFQENDTIREWTSLLSKTEQRLRFCLDSVFLKECKSDLLAPPQSLALHLAPGYREFFTTFLDILSGLKISGGPFELSEKDLAVLYEMWCFIKLGNILRKKFAIETVPEWLKACHKGIGVALQKGKTSKLSLKSVKGETIHLLYNPEERTPTGNKYPDNTLEIRKSGSTPGFHYIFDAKYRLCDDENYVKTHGAPGPPVETINRMHAYRDQIVAKVESPIDSPDNSSLLWDWGRRKYIQKSIAGFILFPYTGQDATHNTFFQSINKVGIGSLPFLPGQTRYVEHLLEQLVCSSGESEEDRAVELYSADEKKRIAWSYQYGLVAIVRHQQQLDYILKHHIYHMPYTRLRGVRLRAAFILFFQSKTKFGKDAGIQYWAKVKSFQVGQRTKIRPTPPWPKHSKNLYAWFTLDEVQRLPNPIPTSEKGYPTYFRVTTRLAFEEAKTIEELSLIREPERRLYHELQRAGFTVQVREDTKRRSSTYNIEDLKLIFRISQGKDSTVNVRFDLQKGAFFSGGKRLFSFEDLMFEAEKCTKYIKELCKSTTQRLLY
jgi:hypothetical protein